MINAINKIIQAILLVMLLGAIFTNCRKKAWDEFYGRPDSLADPIYQQLDARGNFTNLLALIDKGGYKATLGAAGYWTFFAPNDDAFKAWFQERGISNVDAIDSATSRAMIQYLLVYNSFKKERLDDYQATIDNAGWTPSQAFRRRTAYYTGFYKDTGMNNRSIVAVANNRNTGANALDGNYVSTDYNNKYITYFTDDYFSSHNLSSADYKYFYPNSDYTGFNVAQAKVINKDIAAENGTIHEIDKVVTPLMSIDEYIRTRPEYSSFKALLNRLYVNKTVQFIYNADASHRYQVVSGKNDSVFVKVYSNLLAFAPNNENFLKQEDNDGQKDCWTLFIPRNDAVDAYVKNVLCRYYPSLDEMPIEIIGDFINSHLFPTAVWPSKFAVTRNNLSEPANFDPVADVFDRKVLSNGFLYGTNKVQEADVFKTVFSNAYLHPDYTMMTRLLNESGLKLLIAHSNVNATLLLIPDQVFSAAGYSYNVSKSQFEYKPAGGSATTNAVYDKLIRLVQTCVFFSPYKEMMEDLSGTGIIKSGDAGTEGDFIKFDHNKIITAGLADAGEVANVDSVKFGSNGKIYYLNKLPFFSEKGVGTHLKQLGLSETSSYHLFWKYLENSSIYNPNTTEIVGLTGFNTLFIPDNNAVLQAVNDGLLPGTGTAPNMAPNFTPSDEPGKELVRKFLQYHILSGRTVVPDGNAVNGLANSFLKDEEGNAIRFSLNSDLNVITLTDNYNLTRPGGTDAREHANLILSESNNLSSRAVIHLINKYLNYNIY